MFRWIRWISRQPYHELNDGCLASFHEFRTHRQVLRKAKRLYRDTAESTLETTSNLVQDSTKMIESNRKNLDRLTLANVMAKQDICLNEGDEVTRAVTVVEGMVKW